MKIHYICATLLLLIVFVVTAGCARESVLDAKEYYYSFLNKSNQIPEYRAVYDITVDAVFSLKAKMALSKKDDSTKVLTEMNMLGQSISITIYNISNKVVTCVRGTSFTGEENRCTIGNDLYSSELDLSKVRNVITNNTNYTYVGASQIIGRPCEKFFIEVFNFTNFLSPDEQKNSSKLNIHVCVDQKTGVPLFMNMSISTYSEIEGTFIDAPFMTLTASSIAESVSKNEFDLPVTFIINDIYCVDEKVFAIISPLKIYDGKVNFTYDRYYENNDSYVEESVQVNAVLSTNKSLLSIVLPVNESSVSESKICVGSDCQPTPYCSSEDTDKCFVNTSSKNTCEAMGCLYDDGVCTPVECYEFDDKTSCDKYKSCFWQSFSKNNGYCQTKSCISIKNETECESSELTCDWFSETNRCYEETCRTKDTKKKCEDNGCSWLYHMGRNYCDDKKLVIDE